MSFEILVADLEYPPHQAAICDLLNSYASDLMGRGMALSAGVQKQLIEGLKEHPTTLVLLAFAENHPVGLAVCFRGFSTFAAKPLLNIHDLAVLPEYRGQGIGRQLLTETHRRAAELGCCKVTLEVREDNDRAQRLYRSLGYGVRNGDGEAAMLFWEKALES